MYSILSIAGRFVVYRAFDHIEDAIAYRKGLR